MKKGTPLLVGNWKSFIQSPTDALKRIKAIDKGLPRSLASSIVICPPALIVAYLRTQFKGKRIKIGVQDISLQPQGAHTGEVTATLAKASGADYAIVGHAERRAAGETNEVVAGEARAALDAGLVPIICLGEGARDHAGAHFVEIEKMLGASVAKILPHEIAKVVIAYEPVWAIGAAAAPDARTVSEATLYIRKTLATLYGRDAALKTKILYGGAVDESSAGELLRAGNIGGFLVGRASVDPSHFLGIIRACQS